MLAREVCGWRPGELSIRALEPSEFICWRSQNMPPMSRNSEALVEERLRTSFDTADLTESEPRKRSVDARFGPCAAYRSGHANCRHDGRLFESMPRPRDKADEHQYRRLELTTERQRHIKEQRPKKPQIHAQQPPSPTRHRCSDQ